MTLNTLLRTGRTGHNSAGIHPRAIPNKPDGTLDLRVEAAIMPDDVHSRMTKARLPRITLRTMWGVVVSLDYIASVRSLCDKHSPLHLDGARICNAAMLWGRSKRVARDLTCIHVSLEGSRCSRWLGTRGTKEFIEKARRDVEKSSVEG